MEWHGTDNCISQTTLDELGRALFLTRFLDSNDMSVTPVEPSLSPSGLNQKARYCMATSEKAWAVASFDAGSSGRCTRAPTLRRCI